MPLCCGSSAAVAPLAREEYFATPKDIRSKCAYEYALDLGFIIETQFNPELVNVVTSNHASLQKIIMSPL